MRRVIRELQVGRKQVAAHPFFAWLRSDALPLERRFVFAPVMIDFIMGFADLNKWFLAYEEPQDELERAINQHTEEDRTHSHLFYDNWYTLALGELGDWPPGKMLWWLFHSSDAGIVRRFGMDLLALSTQHPDPLVRFPMMEAIEICGDVFFGHTVTVASALSREQGVRHLYFGQHHRERETGHLHADEKLLLGASLDDAQFEKATFLVRRVYTLFLAVLDRLLEYAGRAADYPRLLEALDHEYKASLNGPLLGPSTTVRAEPAAPPLPSINARVAARLAERTAELERHPLLAWLRSSSGPSPRDKLRGFVALWGVDIAGYKDFNELVLRYPSPAGPLETAVNRWTENLATHGALFLRDWQALDMDRVVRWNAGESIAFYFLSPETEIHRRNMARVKRHAFTHEEPVVRFWLMKALETTGEVLFGTTALLAEAIEDSDGVTLDYWAHRHTLAHAPNALTTEEIEALLMAQELTPEQESAALAIVETVFDNMLVQFDLSLDVAVRQVFVKESHTLPPPRISDIVPAMPLELASRAG